METRVTQSEGTAQLNQIHALKATRDRVIEIKDLMVPLVERMAAEGNSLLAISSPSSREPRTQWRWRTANMDARDFIEENTDG